MLKGILNAKLYAENESMFRCPLCSSQMRLYRLKSLICTNRHCFDLSKYGYINLLTHALQAKYDKKLFQSRRNIFEKGFFDPVHIKISDVVLNYFKNFDKTLKILDAGCGEGSSLSTMLGFIGRQMKRDALGVGLDISKEGISMASKKYKNMLWCVGDLANAPFADKQFDLILNILAPANYKEFKRLVAGNGIIIKVIPERNYLKELREALLEQSGQKIYSNDSTIGLFKNNFKVYDIVRVQYMVDIGPAWFEPLVNMTPLSWGAAEENILKTMDKEINKVTVDLSILVGMDRVPGNSR